MCFDVPQFFIDRSFSARQRQPHVVIAVKRQKGIVNKL